MPIRVDNGLLHLCLHLGLDADATLSVLFDSGATLSSGHLPCHLWIMRKNPDVVASFERFDDSNPFEPIKLGGAIRHPDDHGKSSHVGSLQPSSGTKLHALMILVAPSMSPLVMATT
jgi:hypothetical protein